MAIYIYIYIYICLWKLCIVCEAVLKKAIAEMLTEMALLFMITLIWKLNYGSETLTTYSWQKTS